MQFPYKKKYIQIGIVGIVILITLLIYFNKITKKENYYIYNKSQISSLPVSQENNSDNKLDNIFSCEYNIKEIVKNSLLLEDHLNQKRKRCQDCISKHLLLLEAYADELVSLDKDKKNTQYYYLAKEFKRIQYMFLQNTDYQVIAQEIRKIRKPLMKISLGQ